MTIKNQVDHYKDLQSSGISTCISRCEQSIYPVGQIESCPSEKAMRNTSNSIKSFENASAAQNNNLETILNQHKKPLENTRMVTEFASRDLNPFEYLDLIESYVPKELISSQNFTEIKDLASRFTRNMTSFFGFESNLCEDSSKSDYLLAISSKNGEREALLNILTNKELPPHIINREEWKNITRFTQEWVEQHSIINENVLGLWFEFDTSRSHSGFPIPNIFLQTKKIRIDTKEDLKNFKWFTKVTIPMLTRKNLSMSVEKKLIEAVKKLPEKTSVIHIGTMLSRQSNDLRIVINRIKPTQVIPYLQSLGYKYSLEKLEEVIQELNRYVSRLILHLNIDDEIGEKIGLECSFSYDKYHEETEWEKFLDYLQEKNLCIPEKKEALLNFIGAEIDTPYTKFISSEYIPSVMIKENKSVSSALVRYISHIKIVYTPNKPLMAKAYPGVRLLSSTQ